MNPMDNQPLGPRYIQPYSLLDSTDEGDMFTAYCDRHTQEMEEINMPVKYNGAVYSLKDPFRVYTCPNCRVEVAKKEGMSVNNLMFAFHMKYFLMWDDCDAPGDWFEYMGEYEDLDQDIELMGFDR